MSTVGCSKYTSTDVFCSSSRTRAAEDKKEIYTTKVHWDDSAVGALMGGGVDG